MPPRPNRRAVLSGLAALAVAPAAPGQDSRREAPASIDGMGELHPDYDPSLIDEMLASGLRGIVVTVGNPALQGASAFDDMKSEAAATEAHIAREPMRLLKVLRAADFAEARRTNRLGVLRYTQNATPIGDDAGRLKDLKALGILGVQLTYNTRNLVGDGCLERTNSGLSTFGLDVVAAMNDLGMFIDASHTGEASTNDAITFSKKPVAINHAGCRSVFDHARNKSDRLLRLLGDRGGVIGIFQINPYVGRADRNTIETFLDHVDHAVNTAGIDAVGIGSDRDHRVIADTPEEKQKLIDELSRLRPVNAANFRWPFFIAELNGPKRMEAVYAGLRRRRYTEARIEKILWTNFERFFRETIP